MVRTCGVLFAFLQTADALRQRRQKHEEQQVGGVPMLNYRYRHLQTSIQTAGPDIVDWVIKFKDGLDDDQLVQFCGGEAGVGKCWSVGHPGHAGVPLATVRSSERELATLLQAHPGLVDFVEPDSPVFLEPVQSSAEETMQQQRQWNLEQINKKDATFSGKGVNIYVMDSGVRVTHRDFGGRAIRTMQTVDGIALECAGLANCAWDDNGHGTHVAATAGGNTFGVASQATIHAMKVCCGAGTNINVGMDWVAQFARKPAVMTMSIGSYSTPESARVAVDAVVASGVTVTVSAGNMGTNSCFKSYTFIASALGVGASTDDYKRASFSNYGECNAIFAPGANIISASYENDFSSAVMSGTSMATPLVAGACALLLEEEPSLTPAKVRSTLRERATEGLLGEMKDGDSNLLLNVGFSVVPTPAPPVNACPSICQPGLCFIPQCSKCPGCPGAK